MWRRKFGIAEAKRADQFVGSMDNRGVVLAIARMFNIPITVQKEGIAECKRLKAASTKETYVIASLEKDLSRAGLRRDAAVRMYSDVDKLANRWIL